MYTEHSQSPSIDGHRINATMSYNTTAEAIDGWRSACWKTFFTILDDIRTDGSLGDDAQAQECKTALLDAYAALERHDCFDDALKLIPTFNATRYYFGKVWPSSLVDRATNEAEKSIRFFVYRRFAIAYARYHARILAQIDRNCLKTRRIPRELFDMVIDHLTTRLTERIITLKRPHELTNICSKLILPTIDAYPELAQAIESSFFPKATLALGLQQPGDYCYRIKRHITDVPPAYCPSICEYLSVVRSFSHTARMPSASILEGDCLVPDEVLAVHDNISKVKTFMPRLERVELTIDYNGHDYEAHRLFDPDAEAAYEVGGWYDVLDGITSLLAKVKHCKRRLRILVPPECELVDDREQWVGQYDSLTDQAILNYGEWVDVPDYPDHEYGYEDEFDFHINGLIEIDEAGSVRYPR